jgi:hypothetical protein
MGQQKLLISESKPATTRKLQSGYRYTKAMEDLIQKQSSANLFRLFAKMYLPLVPRGWISLLLRKLHKDGTQLKL